ncbi:ANIS5 family metal-binding protein [Vibrio fluvialis]|uniref:hypothetical protein n=1 Tax=Vibrio fluvialis TaxID=676 RepID=UPI001C9CF2A2|nr:hypothetical protein [Vibrio fluvialis]EKO3395746.1 hypothetical protein [Vibrio fluvialis]MBY7924559.1 hypothetical protein [Vibrio fluvialis]MBY7980284.1 hypothetical protein [Vibrio fluvialis]MCE7625507.1 hypothetical protein [Vibrio fluvialis]MDZ5515877.1 hypothetical protein [Vibrio fluvialis]
MKTLLNSLQENTISRLKNPLVGAYVFSWTIWNITDVIIFLLSDTSGKIAMVKGATFELHNDFLVPLGLCFIYLVFVPVLNMCYERVVDGVINKRRNAFKQKTLQDHYYSVKKTTVAKLDSDEEENRKLRDRQLDHWVAEKQKMSETIIQFRSDHADKMARIDSEVANYREEIRRLTGDVYDTTTEAEAIRSDLTRAVKDIRESIEKLKNIKTLPVEALSISDEIILSINRSRKVLQMPLELPRRRNFEEYPQYLEPPMDFDDDIPF